MNADRAIEVSVHIAAEPETVFPYFTDAGRYVQWMGAGAVLEPVPGGCYRIVMRDGDPPRSAAVAHAHKNVALWRQCRLDDRIPRPRMFP